MYICGLILLNFTELAEAVPIALQGLKIIYNIIGGASFVYKILYKIQPLVWGIKTFVAEQGQY